MIIVDTTVLAEPLRTSPNPAVLDWLRSHANDLAITAITIGELRYGAFALESAQRNPLLDAIDTLAASARERILPYDVHAADNYARLRAERDRTGRPIGDADLMTAAISITRRSAVATRHAVHLGELGVDTIDPWS